MRRSAARADGEYSFWPNPDSFDCHGGQGLACYVKAGPGPGFVNYRLAGNYSPAPIEFLFERYASSSVVYSNGFAANNAQQFSGT